MRHNPNVIRLVVGNETIFRHEHTAAEIAKIVRRVKQESPVPVATADNWKTFIDHPELVDAVDQVFAHIIPYWEGLPQKSAVKGSLAIYDRLRAAYPGKKIVIGEFGWPSAGHNFERAVPGPFSQAALLRDFVAEADALGIDYNIVEAIDQPEKVFEGNVGPYWGILDASLRPKFAWTGPLVDTGISSKGNKISDSPSVLICRRECPNYVNFFEVSNIDHYVGQPTCQSSAHPLNGMEQHHAATPFHSD